MENTEMKLIKDAILGFEKHVSELKEQLVERKVNGESEAGNRYLEGTIDGLEGAVNGLKKLLV